MSNPKNCCDGLVQRILVQVGDPRRIMGFLIVSQQFLRVITDQAFIGEYDYYNQEPKPSALLTYKDIANDPAKSAQIISCPDHTSNPTPISLLLQTHTPLCTSGDLMLLTANNHWHLRDDNARNLTVCSVYTGDTVQTPALRVQQARHERNGVGYGMWTYEQLRDFYTICIISDYTGPDEKNLITFQAEIIHSNENQWSQMDISTLWRPGTIQFDKIKGHGIACESCDRIFYPLGKGCDKELAGFLGVDIYSLDGQLIDVPTGYRNLREEDKEYYGSVAGQLTLLRLKWRGSTTKLKVWQLSFLLEDQWELRWSRIIDKRPLTFVSFDPGDVTKVFLAEQCELWCYDSDQSEFRTVTELPLKILPQELLLGT